MNTACDTPERPVSAPAVHVAAASTPAQTPRTAGDPTERLRHLFRRAPPGGLPHPLQALLYALRDMPPP